MTGDANPSPPVVSCGPALGPRPKLLRHHQPIILAAALIIPRIARVAWPEMWLEDTDYMHAGLLVSHGLVPFRDFPSPHFPVLEWFLGAIYWFAGPSLRLAELTTQVTVGLTGFLVYWAVSRWRGFAVGVAAAFLYSCASLIFRYHLFEREVFTNFLLAAGIVMMVDGEGISRRRLVGLVLLGVIAGLVKLTALLEWLSLALFLAFGRQEYKESGYLIGGIVLGMLVASTVGVSLSGDAFVAQVFVFHTLKGRIGTLGSKLGLLRLSLDVTGVLGMAGLAVTCGGKRFRGGERCRAEFVLLVALLVVPLVFYLLLSPTFWPHNVIPLLIPLCWLGGVFLIWFTRALTALVRGEVRSGGLRCVVAIGLVFAGLLLFPVRNENWRMGSAFGFGFQDRAEIGEIAQAVRDYARPEEQIIAPPYVAVEADRRKLVHYREVAGPVRIIEEAMETGGFAELRAQLRDAGFFEHMVDAVRFVGAEMEDAIRRQAVPVVVPDSRFSLVSETRVRERFLGEHGYREVKTTEHYTVWAASARDRTNPTR